MDPTQLTIVSDEIIMNRLNGNLTVTVKYKVHLPTFLVAESWLVAIQNYNFEVKYIFSLLLPGVPVKPLLKYCFYKKKHELLPILNINTYNYDILQVVDMNKQQRVII